MAKSNSTKNASPRRKGQSKRPNQLRIIGGQWRGRRLSFPDSEGLRPTPDRVRETLFNWLAAHISGAHCLDLFAGSGALGLEALSRGAAEVDFVDASALVVRNLRENLQLLKNRSDVWHSQAQQQLHQYSVKADKVFDIVFLDPPFGQQLLKPTIELIERHALLAHKACVYIESGVSEALPSLPANWYLHREKTAGQVCYRLFLINAAQAHNSYNIDS